jgi:predicted secreted protein
VFTDKRGKKIIFVAHCVLNQNAKLDECAYYSGVMTEITQFLIKSGVGIIQMPCLELISLGLDRDADLEITRSVASEDTRIAKRMIEERVLKTIQDVVDRIVYQIIQYQKNGFEVIGLIGVNGSPTCGVEISWANDAELKKNGIFIKMLTKELQNHKISINMRGVIAKEPKKALEIVKGMFN